MKTPTEPYDLEAPFEPRACLNEERARRYNPCVSPRTAMNKLGAWIRHNKELHHRLYEEGPEGKNDITFSLRQVRLLLEYLGEP